MLIILVVSDLLVHFNIHLITSVVFKGKLYCHYYNIAIYIFELVPSGLQNMCVPHSVTGHLVHPPKCFWECVIFLNLQEQHEAIWDIINEVLWWIIQCSFIKIQFWCFFLLGKSFKYSFCLFRRNPSRILIKILCEFNLKQMRLGWCYERFKMLVAKKLSFCLSPCFNFFHQFILYLSWIQIKIL